LIGDNHAFIDLVFYHRGLKCHVRIDLLCGRPHKRSTTT
jgi:predicted nuclease of restriction endonuclease-like (RecB) superfamily